MCGPQIPKVLTKVVRNYTENGGPQGKSNTILLHNNPKTLGLMSIPSKDVFRYLPLLDSKINTTLSSRQPSYHT